MLFKEFKGRLENEYKKYFPDSLLSVSIYKMSKSQSILIKCYLAGCAEEEPFGYFINDMFNVTMDIDLPSTDNYDYMMDNLPEELTLSWDRSSFSTTPDIPYMAYGAQKVAYRKVKGNQDKVIKAFGKYVKRLYDGVVDCRNKGKIANDYKVLFDQKVSCEVK